MNPMAQNGRDFVPVLVIKVILRLVCMHSFVMFFHDLHTTDYKYYQLKGTIRNLTFAILCFVRLVRAVVNDVLPFVSCLHNREKLKDQNCTRIFWRRLRSNSVRTSQLKTGLFSIHCSVSFMGQGWPWLIPRGQKKGHLELLRKWYWLESF